jgi:pimeloyl-ACP methyl ester carboxylesterase
LSSKSDRQTLETETSTKGSAEEMPIDVLGFSIGSFVAQEIALTRPSVVNRVVLASSAPKGAEHARVGPIRFEQKVADSGMDHMS